MSRRPPLLALLVASLFAVQAMAAAPLEIALWPGVAPGSEKAEQKEQVSFGSDHWIDDMYRWMESLGYTRATTAE